MLDQICLDTNYSRKTEGCLHQEVNVLKNNFKMITGHVIIIRVIKCYLSVLKTVPFIAVKKNPAIPNIFIRFSIEILIANISFYALSWPKLNFGCYLTFEIIF